MADKLRVGIIGANPKNGWAARAHLPAFKAGIPGLELAAVCTTKQESAEESAKAFGAKLAFSDHHKMLAHPDIDAVAVSVKLPHHYQLTMDALNAGKHVYTEWPLGTNTAQAEEMAALAKQKGLRTAVGLQSRRSALCTQVRRLIDDGYIGEVLCVNVKQASSGVLGRTSNRIWMQDKAAGGNTLTITSGHAIDALMVSVGAFESVSSLVSTQVTEWVETDTGKVWKAITAPDQVIVAGRLASGAVASVHVASVARLGTGHRTEIHGSNGTLVIEGEGALNAGRGRLYGAQGDAKELSEIPIEEEPWVREAGLTGPAVNVGKMWKSFGEGIRDGKPYDPDFDAAVRHHKFVDAVQRASDSGQRQTV